MERVLVIAPNPLFDRSPRCLTSLVVVLDSPSKRPSPGAPVLNGSVDDVDDAVVDDVVEGGRCRRRC